MAMLRLRKKSPDSIPALLIYSARTYADIVYRSGEDRRLLARP